MARTITMIPATVTSRFSNLAVSVPKRRRVAGYARVSTEKEEQQSSYEAQVDYYTKYIKERPDWDFVFVYTDVDAPYGQNTNRPWSADLRLFTGGSLFKPKASLIPSSANLLAL